MGSSPALSSNGTTVFVGSVDKKVYAVCATSGTQKWLFKTGGGVWSSPAVSSDGTTVFVGSRDNKVYAICATSGTGMFWGFWREWGFWIAPKWVFETGGEVVSSPALSSDGATVFVGSKDNKVYALSVKPKPENQMTSSLMRNIHLC